MIGQPRSPGILLPSRQIAVPGQSLSVGAAAGGNWWEVAGKTCEAAWQAIGADDLADSYINLANPGTYNISSGAPTSFSTVTGWTFDGTDYLVTDNIITGTGARTVSVRMTPDDNAGRGIVTLSSTAVLSSLEAWDLTPELAIRIAGGNKICDVTDTSDFVAVYVGPAATTCANASIYKNGELVTQTSSNDTAYNTGTGNTLIAGHSPGGPGSNFDGVISAMSIYSDELTADEVASLTTAMAALT